MAIKKFAFLDGVLDNNNELCAYKLIDENDNIIEMSIQDIREALSNSKIQIIKRENVSIITRSIIEKISEHTKALGFKKIKNIEAVKAKANLIGATVEKLEDNIWALITESNITIMSHNDMVINRGIKLFNQTKFTKIDFANVNTHYVTDMTDMFLDCEAKEIDFTNFDTSNTTNMGAMFKESGIEKLDLSNFDTSKVENMSGMFSNTVINSLNVSSFNTSNVKNMSSMFFKAIINDLDLTSFDIKNVVNMMDMFNSCKINSININSFKTNDNAYIEHMFKNCVSTKIEASDNRIIEQLKKDVKVN